MPKEITTYQDLYDYLGTLTPEQRQQVVQTAPAPCTPKPVECEAVISIGTMHEFEFDAARSVVDNKFHSDAIVLLTDGNPFGEDGAIAYKMKFEDAEDWIENMSKYPVYGKDGKTDPKDQQNPNLPQDAEIAAHNIPVMAHRIKGLEHNRETK